MLPGKAWGGGPISDLSHVGPLQVLKSRRLAEGRNGAGNGAEFGGFDACGLDATWMRLPEGSGFSVSHAGTRSWNCFYRRQQRQRRNGLNSLSVSPVCSCKGRTGSAWEARWRPGLARRPVPLAGYADPHHVVGQDFDVRLGALEDRVQIGNGDRPRLVACFTTFDLA